MALLSMLVSREAMLKLNEDQIDTLWGILEAELIRSPEVMEHLSRAMSPVTETVERQLAGG